MKLLANINWIVKWVPPILRRRKFTPIATYVEPCGVWGIRDLTTKKTEVCGILYSANIIAENENGKLVKAREWIPGPDLRPKGLVESETVRLI